MAPNAEQEAADRKPEDKRLGKKAYERALRELQVKLNSILRIQIMGFYYGI